MSYDEVAVSPAFMQVAWNRSIENLLKSPLLKSIALSLFSSLRDAFALWVIYLSSSPAVCGILKDIENVMNRWVV